MSDGALHRYFLNNSGPRLDKWLHYFDIYERHFARFRNKSPVFLEIGIGGGGSLPMWRDYFGKGCKIIGVDVEPNCQAYAGKDMEVYIGSQDDPALWKTVLKAYPTIDIVLDDGSHIMRHMISTFDLLYEKVQPRGIYAVEDTHTSYRAEFDGGFRAPDTFMEFVKDKLDEINAVHSRGAMPVSAFTKSTDSITTYDSVVVFERRPQGHRQGLATLSMVVAEPSS